ncbi:MAG: UDP-N-acetylmuramate--L-alanine ligase [Lachnospiraceae bacterium]|nr:UDP-N-acetylmuramate--L-alanine ligase [Lachnospiraceae bacterium]
MYNMDFNKPCHIHFIGIGGISMSGLAEILLKEGFQVSGSDNQESDIVKSLVSEGVKVAIGQCAANITDDIDVICYTAAIHEDNEEFKAAKSKNLPMLSRAELLGQMMTNYKQAICIAGTHGKTTTTSMLSHILMDADTDPTISVGGILDAIGGNVRVGGPDIFLTEACEYTNSFLSFFPTINAILNVEEDHMDFFKDIDDIRNSFHRFSLLLPKKGLLVINKDIEKLSSIIKGVEANIITFGSDEEADYYAANIDYDDHGFARYDLYKKEEEVMHVELSVTGEHNIYNSIAAIIIALELDIAKDAIISGLKAFTGTHRRFELKGEMNGVTIVDDYAHHPTEIRATLNAATRYPHKDTWVCFQPHTFSRTKAFLHDFADALSLADHVVLADIYAAREVDTGEISSRDIAKLLEEKGVDTHYFPSFSEIEEFLQKNCQKNDLLITMGAGNVVTIGEDLLK